MTESISATELRASVPISPHTHVNQQQKTRAENEASGLCYRAQTKHHVTGRDVDRWRKRQQKFTWFKQTL